MRRTGGLYAEMLENRAFEFVDCYGTVGDYYTKPDRDMLGDGGSLAGCRTGKKRGCRADGICERQPGKPRQPSLSALTAKSGASGPASAPSGAGSSLEKENSPLPR